MFFCNDFCLYLTAILDLELEVVANNDELLKAILRSKDIEHWSGDKQGPHAEMTGSRLMILTVYQLLRGINLALWGLLLG